MKTSVATRNLGLNAELDQLNSGYLRIYSGTEPATPETALSGNTLLAELRFTSTAFAAASSASKTAAAITADTDADATGTATFFRAFKSDGTTVVQQGTVGTSGADLILNTVSIVQHGEVTCESYVASRTQ